MTKIDNMVAPIEGRHPIFQHLIYAEFEPHYSMYLMSLENSHPKNDVLVSNEQVRQMLKEQYNENYAEQFGYIPDNYLELFNQ